MASTIEYLHGLGLALHKVLPKSKSPGRGDWPTAISPSSDALIAHVKAGGNLGVILGERSKTDGGYLHVLDLDIRDAAVEAEALEALAEILPEADRLPCVRSGNALGLSCHYHIHLQEALPRRVMASEPGVPTVDARWKIEFLGQGQQSIMPPSIHPDSGHAYSWKKPYHCALDILDDPRSWGALSADRFRRPELPKKTFEAGRAVDWEQVDSALHHISPDSDHDEWVRVGMALHNASGGGEEGFERFDHWSSQATRVNKKGRSVYPGERKLRQVWKGFRDEPRGDPVTLGTLFHLAAADGWDPRENLFDIFDDLLDDDDPLDDGDLFDDEGPSHGTPAGLCAADPFDLKGDPDLSHDQLALNLGAAGWNRDARYVADGLGRWLIWDGTRWAPDHSLRHMTVIRKFLRTTASRLIEWAHLHVKSPGFDPKEDPTRFLKTVRSTAKTLRAKETVAAVETLARSNPHALASLDQFDSDMMLLGTPGGTVDLRTGELRAAKREDHITRITAVAPAPSGTRPKHWLEFLERTFGGDADLIAFLQRGAGYALTGSTREHRLLFLYGTGRNGKSTFLNALQGMLGAYARTVPSTVFLDSKTEQHSTGMAGLRGARLAVGSELPAGKSWNESVIKDATGGDIITARLMRQDFFDFIPQFTLMIAGNHKPKIKSVDEAMIARIVLVPFTVTIPAAERDAQLGEKLRSEWPAILRWAIEGALAWQSEGLNPPDSVLAASREYLDDEDQIGRFLKEETVGEPGGRVTTSETFERFQSWQGREGMRQGWQKRAMVEALKGRGFEVKRSNGQSWFSDLRLTCPFDDDEAD